MLTVTLSPQDEISQDVVNSWQQTDSRVRFRLDKRAFSKQRNLLSIETIQGRNSSDLLSDNADPDAQYWEMQPEYLSEIVRLLKLLRQNTRSGFVFQAYWVNEKVLEQKEISIDELANLVEIGHIGTKTMYLVR